MLCFNGLYSPTLLEPSDDVSNEAALQFRQLRVQLQDEARLQLEDR